MTFSAYELLVGASLVVILSYLFNYISKKANIPTVILLIGSGILINYGLKEWGHFEPDLFPVLEILGIVGLILIVLEAALDLELSRDRTGLIIKSFVLALVILLITSGVCALILNHFLGMEFYLALIYAIPISIMSSAIIIPSVANLAPRKREFMIYESTFSDILGIIYFYVLVDFEKGDVLYKVPLEALGNMVSTLIIGCIATLALILLLQRLSSRIKLFLSLSILILVYALGKMLHLSSLIIILVFGLILRNHKLLAQGFLKNWLPETKMHNLLDDFHFITAESAFLVRTFFFVIFGMTITLSSLNDPMIYVISGALIAALYVIRFVNLRAVLHSKIFPELFIAPRGLITILLFFSIPTELQDPVFDNGILLVIILGTSLIMMGALIISGKSRSEVTTVTP